MDKQEKRPIVKYHNDLNKITFRSFGSIDFDFFMTLCSRAKTTDGNMVTISFSDFMKLSGYNSKKGTDRFIKELKSMNYKQMLSSGEVMDGSKIKQFMLFIEFEIDQDKETITAEINPKYKYILQELTRCFTRFELEEFVSLDSKYAKTLYRMLKQFRTTGVFHISLDELKRMLGVPKSYTSMKIGQKIIKPSVEMLREYFKNLECKTIYERKPGRPVHGYEFTFEPETVPRIGTAPEQPAPKEPKKPRKQSKNAFHNFEQREYDYDDLERRLTELKRD